MKFCFLHKMIWLFCLLLIFSTTDAYSLQTIIVKGLSSPPAVDGSSDDWDDQNLTEIPLKKNMTDGKSDVQSVSLMAGIYENDIYIYAHWSDSTEDIIHKPFVWDTSEERYIRGSQREDRFSIQFEIAGDYTTRWFSGKEFVADMWHWKAARTNPVNLAHDKMTVISATPMKKSYKGEAKNGKPIYIYRPSDEGDPIYYSKRYSVKESDIMPKYLFTTNPKGSVTDVKARGIWKNGKWMLELKRKMNTGHSDDVVFKKGASVKAGIGLFNSSEANDHNISEILIFQF
jgi:hypothetical protein